MIDTVFSFEQPAISMVAPTIDMDLEFDQFQTSFDETLFQTIEQSALVHAKTTVQKTALYNNLNKYELHVSPENNYNSANTAAEGDNEVAVIMDDTSSNDTPEDNKPNTFQDADVDDHNEEMSMVEFSRGDIYLYSAATGSEDQMFQMPEVIQESAEDFQEFDDEDRATNYARDNLFSADKMFADTIDPDSEPEEDESTPSNMDKGKSTNFDPLGREPPPEDRELKEMFKLKLFTIYEDTEEEKQFAREVLEAAGPLKTFAPVDEMARAGLLFSDDGCDDDTLKSFPNISIESSNFEGYKSGTIDLSKLNKSPSKAASPFELVGPSTETAVSPSEAASSSETIPKPATEAEEKASNFHYAIDGTGPVVIPTKCNDLSRRAIKPLKQSKRAYRLSSFKFNFNVPAPAVPTTAITTVNLDFTEAPAPTTTPTIAEPAVDNEEVTGSELVLNTADIDASSNNNNNNMSLVLVNTHGSDDTFTRVHYHEAVWHSYLAEQGCFEPRILENAQPGIIDYGFIGTVPACFPLPTVYDRVIEELIDTEPGTEPLYAEDKTEHSTSTPAAPTITIAEDTPAPLGHTLITTKTTKAVAPNFQKEMYMLAITSQALYAYLDKDDCSNLDEIAAAINAAHLVMSTYKTNPASIDIDTMVLAIDRLVLVLPPDEPSEVALIDNEPLAEHSFNSDACEAAPGITTPESHETRPSTTQDDTPTNLPIPERSEASLDTSTEAWRIYGRARGLRLPHCTWTLLDRPNVFGTSSGPLLMLTIPEGETKYPQDMKVYGGQSDWADLDDDEDDF
ncbi:hypothetical protein SBRCBS47491_006637 [Sporothrix bragantina]|uniref:Uncharacterized protein n=1 Tax=Sporothrix bragantina TaxID=671064 RepID=A0ABP0C6K3_9PEZI